VDAVDGSRSKYSVKFLGITLCFGGDRSARGKVAR